jgi:hypothetical protein
MGSRPSLCRVVLTPSVFLAFGLVLFTDHDERVNGRAEELSGSSPKGHTCNFKVLLSG